MCIVLLVIKLITYLSFMIMIGSLCFLEIPTIKNCNINLGMNSVTANWYFLKTKSICFREIIKRMWQCSVLRITFWLDYWIYITLWTFVNGIVVVCFHPIYEILSFACRFEIFITINSRILCYCDWKLHVFAFTSKHIFQSLVQLTYNKYQLDVDIYNVKQFPMNDD